jgi:hypothetical protein
VLFGSIEKNSLVGHAAPDSEEEERSLAAFRQYAFFRASSLAALLAGF